MRIWLAVAAIAIAGCEKNELAHRVMGTKIASGAPEQVFASPDGTWAVAFVEAEPAKEQGAPKDLLLGALVAAPVVGGESRRLGGGVSNLPGNVLFSKDGRWLGFLAGYVVSRGAGELRLAKAAGGEAEPVATDVKFFTFSPASDRVAFVANGALRVRELATGETTDVASGVSLAEFALNAPRLLVKRSAMQGGALLAYDFETKKLSAIARGVGSFVCATLGDRCAFDAQGPLEASEVEAESPFTAPKKREPSPGLYIAEGGGAAKKVSADVPSDMRFSPLGGRLAYVAQPKGGANAGDLWIVDGVGDPKQVSQRVQSFQFSPDGSLAILGAFDASGTARLHLLPGAATEAFEIAKHVKVLPQSPRAYGFSPQGRWLLFHQMQTLGGNYSIVLGAWKVGQAKGEPVRWIDSGAFGYVMNEDERRLAYKARCIDQGRACALFVQDLEVPAPGTLVAEGMPGVTPVLARVAAFEWIAGRDELAVITSRRGPKLSGQLLFALGTVPPVPNGPVTLLDDQISGDFAFAGPDKRSLVYAVTEKGREGLHKASMANAPAGSVGQQ